MRAHPWHLGVWVLTLLCVATTVRAGDDPPSEVRRDPRAWKSVLLLPYFDDVAYFDYGRSVVTQAIIEVYGDRKILVTRVEDSPHARDWQELVNNVNGLFVRSKRMLDVEAAAYVLGQFSRRLGPDHPYDAFLIPTIGYRFGKVQDFYGVWDGVKRKVKFLRRPGGRTTGWGVITGVSLDLVALDRSMTGKISEGIGGLVIPFEYDWIDKRGIPLPATEVFSDYSSVRDGAEVARDALVRNVARPFKMRFVPEL